VQQPRIIVVDPAGPSGLPYDRLLARLQPLDVRIESSLAKAAELIARDSWDLGVIAARKGGMASEALAAARHRSSGVGSSLLLLPDPGLSVG